jgi:hypothetical protein
MYLCFVQNFIAILTVLNGYSNTSIQKNVKHTGNLRIFSFCSISIFVQSILMTTSIRKLVFLEIRILKKLKGAGAFRSNHVYPNLNYSTLFLQLLES